MTRKEVEAQLEATTAQNVLVRLVRGGYVLWRNEGIVLHGDRMASPFNYSLLVDEIHSIVNDTVPRIDASCTVGSDPEFFFMKDGKVTPSTRYLPPEGTVHSDGFQGELCPHPSTCRQSAALYIVNALEAALDTANANNLDINLDVAHTITDDVWKETPISVKRFGCSPTVNAQESKFKRVTGLREKFRAAGGHIHLGFSGPARQNLTTLIKVMDIVAGNTCVLIDRDPNNARRRKNYGRAGEYRVKSYGVEYRVLSNFWLKSYTLWSMATALLRNAISIVNKGMGEELIALFDMKKVRDAINNNDYDLALENFMIYRQWLLDNNVAANTGLDITNVDTFLEWATSENPIGVLVGNKTVPEIINSWNDRSFGFERFLAAQKA